MRFVREVAVSVIAGICLFIIIPVLKAWDWARFYHNVSYSYSITPPLWALLLFFIGQPVATWDHYRKKPSGRSDKLSKLTTFVLAACWIIGFSWFVFSLVAAGFGWWPY